MVSLTIHRGTRQIGGCVTEIATDSARVFIDIGANLPGCDTPLPAVDGLTAGQVSADSALFLTHYHSDHIGLLGSVLPGLPVWMGKTAKAIQLNYAERAQREMLDALNAARTFESVERFNIGNISVTTMRVDHSAFDAYMLYIHADEFCFLYTGDFRLHGFRGDRLLKAYAWDVDYIICEGTLLSRDGKPPISEPELQQEAAVLMAEHKYVFVLCSSANIDRIAAFYHANPKGRLFVCDRYQKEQLETARNAARNTCGEESEIYGFRNIYDYAPNLDWLMREKGFCMIVRQGEFFRKVMEKFSTPSPVLTFDSAHRMGGASVSYHRREGCLVIYSMWKGYLDGNPYTAGSLYSFIAPYEYKILHTSGHAAPRDLKRLVEAIDPKRGLIPIHCEEPERFASLLPDYPIILLKDGEKMNIPLEGRVGLFFLADGELLLHTCDVSDGEPYGDFVNYPESHDKVWRRYAGKYDADFDYYPRGRIVYNREAGTYLLYYDGCAAETAEELRGRYPEGKCEMRRDGHYLCHVCNPDYVR